MRNEVFKKHQEKNRSLEQVLTPVFSLATHCSVLLGVLQHHPEADTTDFGTPLMEVFKTNKKKTLRQCKEC